MAGLAGLRVGYAVADPDCAALMNRIRQPFNVNTLAQVAALAALQDEAHVRRTVGVVRDGVRQLSVDLAGLGVRCVPSRANFVMVEVPNVARVYEKLLKLGVIVRPLASFGLERALRITVGTAGENARLIESLRTVLAEEDARG
jgi:histidinol-phosphate aminotransferase